MKTTGRITRSYKKHFIKKKQPVVKESPVLYRPIETSFQDLLNNIIQGDNLEILKLIPDNTVNLIITSPPYFKQRDYGCGIGNEKTIEEYIDSLINIFSECIRVLRIDGSIIFNLGDKYLEGSLQLIPYRFALKVLKSCQVKLVNNITWVKLNPTPRQYRRRLVSSTEPFFHFVKSEDYYYDLKDFMNNNEIKNKRNNGSNIGQKYFGLIENSDLTLEQKKIALCELQDVIQEVKGEIGRASC